MWSFVRPFVESHQHTVFTDEAFVPQGLGVPTSTILPAIDPFASKNAMLPAYLARKTVAELGIDLYKPLMIQVSRFDPWKDPHGVVDTWRRVREVFPDLQLALVGAMADDDPEGWRIYEEIERETHEEPNCGIPAQVETASPGIWQGRWTSSPSAYASSSRTRTGLARARCNRGRDGSGSSSPAC